MHWVRRLLTIQNIVFPVAIVVPMLQLWHYGENPFGGWGYTAFIVGLWVISVRARD